MTGPALPLESWRDTRDALHMWTGGGGGIQIISFGRLSAALSVLTADSGTRTRNAKRRPGAVSVGRENSAACRQPPVQRPSAFSLRSAWEVRPTCQDPDSCKLILYDPARLRGAK